MAISGTNITSGTGSGTSATTASVSISANRLYLISIQNQVASGTANTPTVTGASVTWTQVTSVGAGGDHLTVLRCLSGSSSSGTLTIDFAAQSQSAINWSVDEFTGIDTSGTNGSAAIVQSATNNNGLASSLTVTLAAFASTSNAAFGCFRKNNTAEAFTVGSGFTSLGTSGNKLLSEYKATSDTTVDASWTTATTTSGIAIEIAIAPIPFFPTTPKMLPAQIYTPQQPSRAPIVFARSMLPIIVLNPAQTPRNVQAILIYRRLRIH